MGAMMNATEKLRNAIETLTDDVDSLRAGAR